MPNPKVEKQVTKRRINLFRLILIILAVALLGRVTYLQVIRGNELTSQANDTRIQEKTVLAQRGTIYDRNHNILSTTVGVSTVILNPANFLENPKIAAEKATPDMTEQDRIDSKTYSIIYDETMQEITQNLADILELDVNELRKTLEKNKDSQYLVLKRNVDKNTVNKLTELFPNSISVQDDVKRSYPYGNLAAHVLGIVGDDGNGLAGVEYFYNQDLRGKAGYTLTEVDAGGRILPQGEYTSVAPKDGSNLVLTLDATIQYYVEKALDEMMSEHNPSAAIIIIADPKTGDILAMGSRPDYDPRKWSDYDESIYSRNPAVNYIYEPGSTFKLVIAATALEENIVHAEDKFYCGGSYTVSGITIKCSDVYGHGAETFADGVANSCNPVYIQTGLKTGKSLLYKYIEGFGFGQNTGIDLPGEEQGLMLNEGNMVPVELAALSIGQAIAVTPVQMVQAACIIANQGKLVKLHIMKHIENKKQEITKEYYEKSDKQVVSAETSKTLLELMQGAVLHGTASKAFVEGYSIAGKTGTAEMPAGSHGYVKGKYVASFIGVAPVEDPQIVALIMAIEPSQNGYYGSQVAAPVFASLGKNILNYLEITPDYSLPVPDDYVSMAQDASKQKSVFNKIPNVLGMTGKDAQNILEAAGFVVHLNSEEAGIVQKQSPGSNEELGRGGEVWLTVQKPNTDMVKVPDLSNLSLKRVGTVLENLDLNLKYTGSGYVINQIPKAGKMVDKYTEVQVTLSSKDQVNAKEEASAEQEKKKSKTWFTAFFESSGIFNSSGLTPEK